MVLYLYGVGFTLYSRIYVADLHISTVLYRSLLCCPVPARSERSELIHRNTLEVFFFQGGVP